MFNVLCNSKINKVLRGGGVGYTEGASPVVLVPKASYEFFGGEGGIPITQLPKLGDKITLTLDGEVYTESVKEIYFADLGANVPYIGNAVVLGGADTGENYFVMFGEMEGELEAVPAIISEMGTSATTTHTMSLTLESATIHPIDPKYLPKTVIDATQFKSPIPDFPTLNDYLLYLYSESKGTFHDGLTFDQSFWEALKTDKPISFIIDATAARGERLCADVRSVAKNIDGNVKTVAVEFCMAGPSGFNFIYVLFSNSFGLGNDAVCISIFYFT